MTVEQRPPDVSRVAQDPRQAADDPRTVEDLRRLGAELEQDPEFLAACHARLDVILRRIRRP